MISYKNQNYIILFFTSMYASYSDVTRDVTLVVESKLPTRKFPRRGSNNHAENI